MNSVVLIVGFAAIVLICYYYVYNKEMKINHIISTHENKPRGIYKVEYDGRITDEECEEISQKLHEKNIVLMEINNNTEHTILTIWNDI